MKWILKKYWNGWATTRGLWLYASCLFFLSGCVIMTKKDGQKIMSLIQGNEKNINQNSQNIHELTNITADGYKLDLKHGQQHQMSSFYRSMALSNQTRRAVQTSQEAMNRNHDITGLDLGQLGSTAIGFLGSLDPTGTGLAGAGLLSLGLNFLQGWQKKKKGLEVETERKEKERLAKEREELASLKDTLNREREMLQRQVKEWQLTAEDAAEAEPSVAKEIIKKTKRNDVGNHV